MSEHPSRSRGLDDQSSSAPGDADDTSGSGPTDRCRFRIGVPAIATSVRETRRDVGRWLVEAGPDLDRSGVDDVLLAIREVVTNAVEHAYADGLGPVIVEVELSGASCAVEVRDHGRWCEPRAVDDTRGRGLLIADTLSRGTLRIDRQATGTTVRFAVPVARDQRPGTGAGSRATS